MQILITPFDNFLCLFISWLILVGASCPAQAQEECNLFQGKAVGATYIPRDIIEDPARHGNKPGSQSDPGSNAVYANPSGRYDHTNYLQGLINSLDTANGQYTIVLAPGTYRVGELRLTDKLRLLGNGGANGEKVVFKATTAISGTWAPANVAGKKAWRLAYTGADETITTGDGTSTQCADGAACQYKRNLFVNTKMAYRVGTESKFGVTDSKNPGRNFTRDWYLNDDTIFLEWLPSDGDHTNGNATINGKYYEIATYDKAFAGEDLGGDNALKKNVTINNITFFGYAENAFTAGDNWQILHCEFTYMHREAVDLRGKAVKVEGNHFYRNNNISISGRTNSKETVQGPADASSVITYNRIERTNFLKLFDKKWQSAALKVTRNRNLEIAFNYVFDNDEAVGLWVDVYADDVHIHDNVVRNNYRGIFYEISTRGEIYQNVIENHSSSGIIVGNSNHTNVTNNTVYDAETGILINQDTRDYLPKNSDDPNDCVDSDTSGDEAEYCDSQIRDIDVLRNKITIVGECDKEDNYKDCNKLVGIRVDIQPNTDEYLIKNKYYNYLAERFYRNPNYDINFNNNHYIFPKRSDSDTWRESEVFYAVWDDTFPQGQGTQTVSFDEWSQNTPYPNGPKRDTYRCIEQYFPNAASRTTAPIQKSVIANEPTVTAYPVPFDDQLTVNIESLALKDIQQVSLVSLDGAIHRIDPKDLHLTNSRKSLIIALPQLAAGMYFLRINSSNEIKTVLVMKQTD